jgi:hypothetical protein
MKTWQVQMIKIKADNISYTTANQCQLGLSSRHTCICQHLISHPSLDVTHLGSLSLKRKSENYNPVQFTVYRNVPFSCWSIPKILQLDSLAIHIHLRLQNVDPTLLNSHHVLPQWRGRCAVVCELACPSCFSSCNKFKMTTFGWPWIGWPNQCQQSHIYTTLF